MHPSRNIELLPDRLWWLLQSKRDHLRTVTTAFEAYEDERFGHPGVTIVFNQQPLHVALFLDARQHFSLDIRTSEEHANEIYLRMDRAHIINRPDKILSAIKSTLRDLPISLSAADQANWQTIEALWTPLLIRLLPQPGRASTNEST